MHLLRVIEETRKCEINERRYFDMHPVPCSQLLRAIFALRLCFVLCKATKQIGLFNLTIKAHTGSVHVIKLTQYSYRSLCFGKQFPASLLQSANHFQSEKILILHFISSSINV
jgi:hypothetical protein